LFALDITACGPWMISQPMVCGPLFGALMHQVWGGVIIGGIVQLLWMDVTPVGVGIPFDVTAVTLLAVYGASLKPEVSSPSLVAALLIAVPFGFLFRGMDFYARRFNTWVARRVEAFPDARLSLALSAATAFGVLWSWVRYSVCYALAMAVVQKADVALEGAFPRPWVSQGLTTALLLLPMAGLGVVLELFLSEEPERRSFLPRSRSRS
jgi:mannose/fructose/N-acetylgalactosamine-specific phosphotransferase system component IIC